MSGSHEKLPWLFWAQLALASIVLILYLLAPAPEKHGEAEHAVSDSSIQALKPVGDVAIASADGSAGGSERSGKEIVEKTCQSCHAHGVAGAPKLDDAAAWESRLGNGMDGLIKIAKAGKGAMPAMGTDPTLSDAELKNAIAYMLEKAGVEVPASSDDSSAPTESVVAGKVSGGSERTGKEIVEKTCQSCHAYGIAGAPKLDDSAKAAWESRLVNGMDGLIKTAKTGKGAMPPMGADSTLSDAELKNAISYMLKKAGVDVPAGSDKGSEPSASKEPSASNEPSIPPEEPIVPKAPAAPVVETSPEAPKSPIVPKSTVKAVAPELVKAVNPSSTPESPAAPQEPAIEKMARAVPEPVKSVEASAPESPVAPEQPAAGTISTVAGSSSSSGSAAKSAIDGKKLYQATCFSCHEAGVAGSPKIADKEAWAPRIATGVETLYLSAINGKGVMPPKGGNMNLSDDQIKAVVDYMVSQSQ